MKTIRDPRQKRLIDPFEGVISETGRRMLSQGWQGVLRHALLHRLPALRLGDDLSDNLGRPSKELHAMCGLLLIREFQNWTVPQTLEAVLFRSDVQYALNLEPGFDISQRTIERYIARLAEDEGLAAEILTTLTDVLVQELEIEVSKQRLDSTHILSDMAVFGRTRGMGVAIKRFLTEVKRRHLSDYESLPVELRERYEVPVGSLFSHVTSSEQRQKTRQAVAEDLHAVIEQFANHQAIPSWPSYGKLVIMFDQQCELSDEKVVVRPNPGGNVILNPSDPDATYSGRKGAGYQVQLSETCAAANEVQLIVAAKVETACTADASAVEPILDDLAARGLQPQELIADAGFGSDDNYQLAEERQVELISPVPGGKQFDEQQITAANFTVDPETHTVTSCPAGHQPLSSSYNEESDRITLEMPPQACTGCPLLERCPVRITHRQQPSKIRAKVYFTMPEHRSTTRRAAQQKPEFRDRYRMRSGIESTNSGLKRRCGLKRLRVRGMAAVQAAVLLKICGWNILQAASSSKLRAKMWKIIAESAPNVGDEHEKQPSRSFPNLFALPIAGSRRASRAFQTRTSGLVRPVALTRAA